MRNRFVLQMFGFIAPVITWIFNLFIPGRRASVLARECRNKCRIMALVQGLESYIDPEGKVPLESIVEKCYALGSFPALWAVEGVGKDLAEWHMAHGTNPKRLLIDTTLSPKWDKAQLMLHAGLGLGFFKYHVERLAAQPSDDELRQAVLRTVQLCRDNSLPGYCGAALESIGLVARFMRDAAFCRRVHAVLIQDAPDVVGYFWRGAGRCLYFHPMNFLPSFWRPIRAMHLCELEAPEPDLQPAMKSGATWALTVVNMTHPQVMEWVLENGKHYSTEESGFTAGVMASVVMRYDTTPNDPLIEGFWKHQPAKPGLRARWNAKISATLDAALNVVYPALKKHHRLEEVFQYQSLPALAERLEKGAPVR